MKKILFIAMFISTTASANYFKICAARATEICKELEGKEFTSCHSDMLGACVDDLRSSNKSVPSCVRECGMVADEALRELCYTTCNEM